MARRPGEAPECWAESGDCSDVAWWWTKKRTGATSLLGVLCRLCSSDAKSDRKELICALWMLGSPLEAHYRTGSPPAHRLDSGARLRPLKINGAGLRPCVPLACRPCPVDADGEIAQVPRYNATLPRSARSRLPFE